VSREWPGFVEWIRGAEISLRVRLEVVPPWLLVLCAIASPVVITAGGLLGLYGLIGVALVFGAVLFAALSYCQLHTRVLVVIAYEIYALVTSFGMLLLAACLFFQECL